VFYLLRRKIFWSPRLSSVLSQSFFVMLFDDESCQTWFNAVVIERSQEDIMRKMAGLSLALLMAVPLAGCGTTRDDRAVNGALLGGATGAVVGGLATGRAGGALAGGAIGAAAGAIIGAETAPQRRCVRWGYDYDGNRICLRYVRVN
jgi:hypothetical protein